MARITNFSDLFAYAHASLSGCPLPLFNQHIQQAGRAFCQESRVWREDLDSYGLVADQKAYTLATTVGSETYAARIEAVLDVRWNTEDGVTNGNKGSLINWRQWDFNPNTNVLTFLIAPSTSVTSGLDVSVILVPHLAATDMNDWVLNIYAETILAKAMHSLRSIKGESWSAPSEAVENYAEYRSGIGKAKADIARQYREGSTGVTS